MVDDIRVQNLVADHHADNKAERRPQPKHVAERHVLLPELPFLIDKLLLGLNLHIGRQGFPEQFGHGQRVRAGRQLEQT